MVWLQFFPLPSLSGYTPQMSVFLPLSLLRLNHTILPLLDWTLNNSALYISCASMLHPEDFITWGIWLLGTMDNDEYAQILFLKQNIFYFKKEKENLLGKDFKFFKVYAFLT